MTYFNLKLYLEGLKKIKLIGSCMFILVMAFSVLLSIISISRYHYGYVPTDKIYYMECTIPLLLLLCFVPFIVYTMFRFLNERKQSDFYHAIPYKRESVYLSFTIAVFTWITVALATSMIFSFGCLAVFGKVSIHVGIVIAIFGIYLAAVILIMGFTLLGMSLTGTFASNIFVTLIFMLSTRIIASIFLMSVTLMTPLIPSGGNFLEFFNFSFFLPLKLFLAVFSAYSLNTFLWSSLYGLFIGIVTIFIAMIIYKKRKSETAGLSALNKRLHYIFRIAITLPFALGTVYHIFDQTMVQSNYDYYSNNTWLIILAGMTVLVYFLYEIITTKGFTGIKKAIPMFLIVIVLSGMFTGGVFAIKMSADSFKPKADEIESVEFVKNVYDDMEYIPNGKVFQSLLKYIPAITDKKIIGIVSIANISSIEDNRYNNKDEVQSLHTITKITLKNGETVNRIVFYDKSELESIVQTLFEDKEFENRLTNNILPEYMYNVYVGDWESLEYGAWNDFLEEFSNMSKEDKINFFVMNSGYINYNNYEKYYQYLCIGGEMEGSHYEYYFERKKMPAFVEKYKLKLFDEQ